MKHLLKIALALCLILVLIQPNDAGILKKGLKLIKKYKKYAYLLASKKNRLYAIPFPMPLPVFVKRQHIYTQVPIIPRYVNRPQPYGAPALSAETAAASYELMSGSHTTAAVRMPNSYSTTYSTQSQRKKPQDSASSSASHKYLSHIAQLLGQSTPNLSSNKDIFSKLLTGQAKVLPPSSLFSAIKTPSILSSSHKHQSASSESKQQQQQQQQEQDQQDQDAKSQSSSSSSSAGGVTYDDTVSNSTKGDSSAASSDSKPAASEVYRSAYMFRRPLHYGMFAANPYAHFPPMMAPMVSPLVALSMAHRASGMRARLPMMRTSSQMASNDIGPLMDTYEGSSNHLEQEPQEMSASSPQDYESSVPVPRDYPSQPAHYHQNLLRQRQQLQLQAQLGPEQYLMAMQRLQRRQLAARQQEILKAALVREHEVAARLAESRQILVRASQLGIPVDQASLLKYYRHTHNH